MKKANCDFTVLLSLIGIGLTVDTYDTLASRTRHNCLVSKYFYLLLLASLFSSDDNGVGDMNVSITMLMFCIMMTAMMMTMIMMIEAANMYTSIHTLCEFFRSFCCQNR